MPLYGSLTVTNPDLLQVPITPLQILDTSGKPSGHIDPTQWNVFIQTLSRVTSNPGAFSSGTGFNYIPINYSQYNDGALPTMSGTATVTYDTGFHIFGAASLKVTNSGTVYFASTSTTYPFGIAPSLTWIISAYCKSDVASAGGTIGIKTATGTYSVPFTASAVAGDTTRIYGILDLSADTGTAFDVEIVSSAGAGKNIWFDGFMLEPQSGSSDVPSPYSTNTPSTVLNVDPSGGVINNLPHSNSSTQTLNVITNNAGNGQLQVSPAGGVAGNLPHANSSSQTLDVITNNAGSGLLRVDPPGGVSGNIPHPNLSTPALQVIADVGGNGQLNVSPTGGVLNNLPHSNSSTPTLQVIADVAGNGQLNVNPTGGVTNTLPLPNHAGPVTSTITGTADANGNYLISGSTSALTDDAAFGLTATYGQVSSLPSTLAGYGITDGQVDLGNAAGTQILEQNSGGTPYWADKYGSEINGGLYAADTSTDFTSTSPSQIGSTLSISNPGQAISLKARGVCYTIQNGTVTTGYRFQYYLRYSTDGGSTWTNGQLGYVYLAGTGITAGTALALIGVDNITPTGDIQIQAFGYLVAGAGGNFKINNPTLEFDIYPASDYSVLAGPLTASVPSTASGNCSAYYPATTCAASANIPCTPTGGAGGNTFSWSKVSGTGTITNSTSQTCTVTDTETTSDAGATHNTVVKCTVTDSALSTATSGNCTFTGTYTRLYNPIVVSVPTTASNRCTAVCGTSCTANVGVTAAVSGGDGSYSHSWTRVSGSTFTLTNTTTATVNVSYTAATTLAGASYSEVIKDTVTDGHSSTGSANSTVTLTFKCYS